jgi:hypothetical protein
MLGIFLSACATTSMQGRLENGKYFSPNGKIVITQYRAGPQQTVRDAYIASLDRGFYEETNAFGLQGMYYTSLTSLGVPPSSTADDRRVALNKGLLNFAMPNIFKAVAQNADIAHQELIVEDGKEMLLVIVRLPELSGAFDVRTNKKFDAYPAILVLVEGSYVIVLRAQSNIEDTQSSSTKDKASHYLDGLRKLKSGLEVRQ